MKHKKYTRQDLNNLESLWIQRADSICNGIIRYCKDLQRAEMETMKEAPYNDPIIYILDKIILETEKYMGYSPGEKIIQEFEKMSKIKVEELGE